MIPKNPKIRIEGNILARVLLFGRFIFDLFIRTLKELFYIKIQKYILDLKELRKWSKMGRNPPPPPMFKQKIVKTYARKFSVNVFIETGTYLGEMVKASRKTFEKIYSIELDEILYRNAKLKFSKFKHISIFQGDSSKILPKILPKINQPCLFWLDAHYSKDNTAKGEIETPIIQELNHIFNISNLNHIILIDDARCFKGKNDYPTLQELKKFISEKKPNYQFIVREDIIRIYQKTK